MLQVYVNVITISTIFVSVFTGGNRGIGRAIAEEYVRQGAKVYITCRAGCTLAGAQVIPNIDVQDNACGENLVAALKASNVKVDILVNNAGYFYEPLETISSLNFEEELKMIDICALGPLRITSALFNAGLLARPSRVAIISSQGGSVAWRFTQNPGGNDYGHHMSKAAANMAGVLLAQELQTHAIAVALLHPGFNKTEMTAKYQSIWEIEGAVSSSVGAKRVIHEIGQINLANTGAFINCEDGKRIPW
ncbi:SDR family NAD(P)-dependent oxidoreductase [archaeon]|nr:MAG: SDR family NAD(P)-dependent oxidoreductase [archaeon]